MIKKISALALAFVLCLSVVVVPASAVEISVPDGATVAYALEWDKEYYKGGDTAVLSVYMDVLDDTPLASGSICIGLNSAFISQTDNPNDDVCANATACDLFESYFTNINSDKVAWLASSVATRVQAANTDAENALYDQYIKYTATKNTAGDHENCANNMDGLYGSEIDSTQPVITFTFVVAEGVEDGTKLSAGITSGSITASPYPTQWKYYSKPGTAKTTAFVDKDTTAHSLTSATAEATIGAAPVASIITNGKPGIRFEKNADGTYANKISVRTKAQIAAGDLQGLIGGITDNDAVEKKILQAGFVYIADANGDLNAATAQTVAKTKADGESIDSHIKKSVSYVQYDGTNYSFTCLITPIEQKDIATASFNTYAYIVIDVDGDGVADDNEWYFANAEGNAVSAKTLYNNLNDDAWEAYGWGTATDL